MRVMAKRATLLRRLTATGGPACHAREPLLLLSAYAIYWAIAKAVPSESAALANADRVIAFERSLGLFWEPDWQDWLLGRGHWAALVANYLYICTYVPLILFTALVLYLKDRRRYFYYRDLVFISLGIFFVVFSLFPVAPPLDARGHGIVDSIALHGPSWYRGEEASDTYNTIAAMPSMHFAWTVAFGIMYVRTGVRWLQVAGILYPLSTLFAIVMTGMHFIVDAIAGGLMVLLAWMVYEGVFRRRLVLRLALAAMEGWRWRHAPVFGRVAVLWRRNGRRAAPAGSPDASDLMRQV